MKNEELEDFNTVLKHKGKIEGIVLKIQEDEFMEKIILPYQKSLSKAKGVLIKFDIGRNSNLYTINELMSLSCEYTSTDCEIIFSTNRIDDLKEKEIICKAFITGL